MSRSNTDSTLQAESLSFSRGQQQVLRDVSLSLEPGEMLGLIGPNGAGKTSLIRLLANLQQASEGKIFFGGQLLHKIPRKQLAQRLAYLPQNAELHWPLRVDKLVALGRIPHQSPWSRLNEKDHQLVNEAISRCDLDTLVHRCVTELSGGEKLRAMLARVFCTGASTILADEPVAALDPYHQLHTLEMLSEHCKQGGNAIVVLHDLNAAAQFCDRIVLMREGRIAAQGKPEQVLQEGVIRNTYHVNTDIIDRPQGRWVIPWSRQGEMPK